MLTLNGKKNTNVTTYFNSVNKISYCEICIKLLSIFEKPNNV